MKSTYSQRRCCQCTHIKILEMFLSIISTKFEKPCLVLPLHLHFLINFLNGLKVSYDFFGNCRLPSMAPFILVLPRLERTSEKITPRIQQDLQQDFYSSQNVCKFDTQAWFTTFLIFCLVPVYLYITVVVKGYGYSSDYMCYRSKSKYGNVSFFSLRATTWLLISHVNAVEEISTHKQLCTMFLPACYCHLKQMQLIWCWKLFGISISARR